MQLSLVYEILGAARGGDENIDGACQRADMVIDIYPTHHGENSQAKRCRRFIKTLVNLGGQLPGWRKNERTGMSGLGSTRSGKAREHG